MASKYKVFSADDHSTTVIVTGVTLKRILQCISSPVEEEQAWAVCHQCCACLTNTHQYIVRPISIENTVLTTDGEIRIVTSMALIVTYCYVINIII